MAKLMDDRPAAKPKGRTPKGRTPEARAPLSRERVLQAAIGLADQSGIDGLSMRKLAQELGVEAMSLYHYFARKEELLNAMLDSVFAEFERPDPAGDWRG